jgi:hypothetical protein
MSAYDYLIAGIVCWVVGLAAWLYLFWRITR